MPTARTKNQRRRPVWGRPKSVGAAAAAARAAEPSSSSPPSSSRSPSSSAMPVATFQRPQPRRANTAPPTTTLDADDLFKRLSMVLAQERQRQNDRERKRQSWEADLLAARREQQRRPPRPQPPKQQQTAPVTAAASSSAYKVSQMRERPTILTAADFQDQPLPSLDEDSPLETIPPRPPLPFILNSSGYVPVYAITSSIKLNNTTLRRSTSADHGRSLRRDAALDLETIDENHGSGSAADENGNNNNKEPTVKSWQLEDVTRPNRNKQRERSPAGLARPSKPRTISYPSDEGDGRTRLRKLPTGARRPSQLGYPPEWSQGDDAQAVTTEEKDKAAPPVLTLVRRGSERMAHYTWSPATAPMDSGPSGNAPARRRSIREKVESYCTLHPRYSLHYPSTSSSSDSGRDDNHSNYSSRSWRSSLKSSISGSRRSSILKFWGAEKQPAGAEEAEGGDTLTDDSETSFVMTPRARKRASLLSVFHL